MLKALITGINGFTGHYVAIELQQAGYQVFGVSHKPLNTQQLSGVEFVYDSDLCDTVRLVQVLEKVQPDVVVHLAAISFVAHADIDEIYRINLLGTRHLLEALLKAGKSTKAVLLASSANVYGNSTAGVLDETTPLVPANDYAVSKVAMEYMARLYSDRLPLIITRPFNYTGVGQAESFLLPKIVSHIQRHATFIELGNLDVARDFSDVRTVVQYYRRLLETPAAIGGTFNVCSGQAYTLQEILNKVREISGQNFEVRVNPAFVRENEIKILLGHRAKLESTVGVITDISLWDTLGWMIEEAGIQ